MVYNVKRIIFRDGVVDTRIYKKIIESRGLSQEEKLERYENSLEDRQVKNNDDNIRRSADRAKQKIYEIARNGRWDWFVTLTFNPDKVNRYDYNECSKKVSDWLSNIRRKSPDMKYIFVPEQHKDGAYHFHGLMSDLFDVVITDSGHKVKGDIIFNLDSYKFGWSTMTRVKQNDAVVKYLTKYITKELIGAVKGKKKYWCSRNVERPKVETEVNSSFDNSFLWQELAEDCLYGREYQSKFNDVMYFQNAGL